MHQLSEIGLVLSIIILAHILKLFLTKQRFSDLGIFFIPLVMMIVGAFGGGELLCSGAALNRSDLVLRGDLCVVHCSRCLPAFLLAI